VRKGLSNRSGESIVECVFVCALVAVIVIGVLTRVGQRSSARVADVGDAMKESNVAGATKPAKPTKP
jgi:Flp pilus assembly pilin Flp